MATRAVAASRASPFPPILRRRLLHSPPSQDKRVVVALSGGVDSSVAAYLLKRRLRPGSDLVGLHMTNWDARDEGGDDDDDDGDGCGERPPPRGDDVGGGERGGGNPPDRTRGGGGRPRRRSSSPCRLAAERDASDARSVASRLSIPFRRTEFASEYWNDVFVPFVSGIASGVTPNPDVTCNSRIKFGIMADFVREEMGAVALATGHYARLWRRGARMDGMLDEMGLGEEEEGAGAGGPTRDLVEGSVADRPEEEWIHSWGGGGGGAECTPLLLSGADRRKDQSYFLCGVPGAEFRDVIFPLGGLEKGNPPPPSGGGRRSGGGGGDAPSASAAPPSVREIALSAGLPTASKRDSAGICFVGKRNFSDFIYRYLPEEVATRAGNYVDVDTGSIVGRHGGAAHLAVGQGARISGRSCRWFVVGRRGRDGGGASSSDGGDDVLVCAGTHHPALYSNGLRVRSGDFNWIGGGGDPPPPLMRGGSMRGWCRVRHLQPLIPCEVELDDDGARAVIVRFDVPIRAVAPGQTAAVYVGDGGLVCLGGGPIWDRGPTYHERGMDVPALLHPSGDNDLSVVVGRRRPASAA